VASVASGAYGSDDIERSASGGRGERGGRGGRGGRGERGGESQGTSRRAVMLVRSTEAPDVYTVEAEGRDCGLLAVPSLLASRRLAGLFAAARPGAALHLRCFMHATFGRWAPE
jgi:hypothetical protein